MQIGLRCSLVLLLLAFTPSGVQASQKSLEKKLSNLSKQLSNPNRSLEARLRMAQVLEQMGASNDSANYYLALLKDERTLGSQWSSEVLDGWERTLRLEISSPRETAYLKAWVEKGTLAYDSDTSKRAHHKTASSKLWNVLEIANGRALISEPRPGVWVRLRGRGVELTVQKERRDLATALSQFGLYLEAPSTDCCLEEIEYTHDDLAYAYYQDEAYIKKFPAGRHLKEARAALEKKLFSNAKDKYTSAGKIAAYRDYLLQYPRGVYAEEAETAMESEVFSVAARSNQVDVYREYLQDYPEGENADTARRQIARLRSTELSKNGSMEKCQEFLREYPQSEYRVAVEKRIEYLNRRTDAMAYIRALQADSEAGYLEYLSAHPRGRKAGAVRLALDRIRVIQRGDSREILDFAKSSRGGLAKAHAAALARMLLSFPQTFRDFEGLAYVYRYLEEPTPSETRRLQAELVSMAIKRKDCADLIRLYDLQKDPVFLAAAVEHLKPSRVEEYEIARRFPKLFLGVSGLEDADPRRKDGFTFMFANDVVSLKPYYRWTFVNKARFAHLRFSVKMKLPVKFHRYYNGIAWFDPGNVNKKWTETFVAEAATSIPPKSSRSADFDFPRFKTVTGTGMENFYSVQLRSEPAGAPEFIFSNVKLVN